jgi:hypothetical protein
VASANGWNVAGPVGPAKYSVTVSRSSAATRSATASDRTSRPAGTAVERCPPKVTVRSDPASTAAPSAARPIVAPVSRRAPVPYTLETRIRTADPPRLTRTGCRTDWLSKPPDQLGVPKKSGNDAMTELDQAPAARSEPAAAGEAGVAVSDTATSAAHTARTAMDVRRVIVMPM